MPSLICPSCHHPIEYDLTRAGQAVTCANCGKRIQVGGASGASPAPVQPAEQASPTATTSVPRVMVGWPCPSCGSVNDQNLARCGQCGAIRTVPVAATGRTDGLAVASLIAGLVPCVPLVPQILAVLFGALSLRRIRRSGGQLGGEGLAWGGLALGLVFGLLWAFTGVYSIRTGTWAFACGTPGRGGALTGPAAGRLTALGYMTPATMPAGLGGGQDEDYDKVAETFALLGRALKAYLNDFKRLPASLEHLVPSYAKAEWLVYADGLKTGRKLSYVPGLDPGRDDPNAIVVYTEPLVPPPPARFGYSPYASAAEPSTWEDGKAPAPTKRMILRLNWESSLIPLAEFDACMSRQRGQDDERGGGGDGGPRTD